MNDAKANTFESLYVLVEEEVAARLALVKKARAVRAAENVAWEAVKAARNIASMEEAWAVWKASDAEARMQEEKFMMWGRR